MTFSLRKPSEARVRAFRVEQQSLDYTYAAVGATATELPSGYVVDRTRVKLGQGAAAFAAGRAALEQWEQFRLGWVEPLAPLAELRAGEVAAIGIRAGGVWWLNAARIVYVVEEETSPTGESSQALIPPLAPPFKGGGHARFGFAYGTLPGHAESGEERFLVEWDRGSDEVWYSIVAFSRPRHWLARVGKPLVRVMQRRFQRGSMAAMARAVAGQRPSA